MSENFKVMLFLTLFILFWTIFYHVWRHIRSARLKRLASKYKLGFSKNFKFFYPGDTKFNLLSGTLNGRNVEIFDLVSYKSYGAGAGRGIDSYRTVLQIDDDNMQTKNSFMNITSIEEELNRPLESQRNRF
ncbi:MAG: hypothetical protein Q7S61_06505 [bacterium]|nr:hypothetical protein [bacterium]